ncbi:unnamed protein product [Absidia cylindrospora]
MTPRTPHEANSKAKKRNYSTHSEDLKSLVIAYHLGKLVSATKAGKEYGVDARTTQQWIKAYKESGQKDETNDKKSKPGPKPRLGDEHKRVIIDFVDNNSSAVVDQVVDSLTKQFEGLVIKKTVVHDFMKNECNLSLKKAHFHPLARNSEETINKRYEWIMKWMNSDMDFTTNCVFIDEAAFNINHRRSFGWAEKGKTPIVKVATTRAASLSANRTLNEKSVSVLETQKKQLEKGRPEQQVGTIWII